MYNVWRMYNVSKTILISKTILLIYKWYTSIHKYTDKNKAYFY